MFSSLFSNRAFVFLAMIIMAMVSWIYVTAAESRVDNFPGQIPVTLKNVPDQLVALPETDTITVRLRADQRSWSLLSVDSFSAQLDLKGLVSGIHEVPVTVAVSVPNVQIVEKKPATITVRLEESVSKDVPVRVVVQGKAAAGKAPGEPNVTPDHVSAVGAKSIVAAVTEAQAIVTLGGEGSDVQRTVELVAQDQQGDPVQGIRFEPASVGVSIPIVQASNTKTVGVRVVTIGAPNDGYYVQKIAVSPSTVVIAGSAEIDAIDTTPIDLTNLAATKTFTVDLVFPTGITSIDRVTRASVTLTIAPLPISKQVPVTYTFTDLDSVLKVDQVTPASGSVAVAGPSDVLTGLNAVTATVSLSGLSAGTHAVNITSSLIQAPEGVTVSGSPTPSAISVTLSPK